MKKILHKLRVWVIRKLGGVPKEAFSAAVKENAKLWKDVSDRDRSLEAHRGQIKALKIIIREICRRSETSYYDWCCEYCGQELIKCRHNGWCRFFAPAMDREDGGINE